MNLSPLQKLILDSLQENPDGVKTSTLADIRAPEPERMSNFVACHIGKIRKYLKKSGDKFEIETLRGSGYRLVKR